VWIAVWLSAWTAAWLTAWTAAWLSAMRAAWLATRRAVPRIPSYRGNSNVTTARAPKPSGPPGALST